MPDWLIGTRRAPPSEAAGATAEIAKARGVDLEGGPESALPGPSLKDPSTAAVNYDRPTVRIMDDQGPSDVRRRSGIRSAEASRATSQISLVGREETGNVSSRSSLEHGVHVVTDGKEEVVGHGYASLRPADDSSDPEARKKPHGKDRIVTEERGANQQVNTSNDEAAQHEMQGNASKTVSFAQ